MMNHPSNINNFDVKGLSPSSIVSALRKTRDSIASITEKKAYYADFTEVLYLNSSDPVEALHSRLEDLRGKTISTVAGSGEFAQVFLNKGAKRIEIFDVSAPGLFFNELKIEALRKLSSEDYRALFDTSPAIFDRDIYRHIADSLSPQAKSYFDTLCLPSYSPFLEGGLISRERPMRDHRFWSFMKHGISDDKSYEALQKKARQAAFFFNLEDICDRSATEEGKDLIYLSNVPELMLNYELIADFIKKGNKRILFTQDNPIKNDGRTEVISDYGSALLNPGDSFKLKGMTARLFACDRNLLFNTIIEVRSEDNSDLTLS